MDETNRASRPPYTVENGYDLHAPIRLQLSQPQPQPHNSERKETRGRSRSNSKLARNGHFQREQQNREALEVTKQHSVSIAKD